MRYRVRLGILHHLLGLALVAGLIAAPAAQASFDCGVAWARCEVQLDNSGRAWFGSNEKLTEDALSDPKNGVFQVYERVGNRTVLISRYPDGRPIPPENKQSRSAELLGVSPDGERVYIRTDASLVPEDGDAGHEGGSTDGYVLSGGAYSMFTTGPLDGPVPNPNPDLGDHAVWASDDGQYLYFGTAQRLVPEDWDDAADIYLRSGGETRLVSTGPDQTLPAPGFLHPFVPEARFLGASPDGATAYFATEEHLTPDDTEKLTSDIFAWHDGATLRLTRTVSAEEVPGAPWESFEPYSFAGAGEEGFVYFSAQSRQIPEDTDDNADIYRARPDGTLERVITAPGPSTILRVEAVSHDGRRLFLETNLRLLSVDRDQKLDIYMWSAGRYELISPEGPTRDKEEELHFSAISGDGKRAYFTTWATLAPQDTDEEPDVYEWNEGSVRLVSPSVDGRQAASFFMGISPNGRFVAFSSWEVLLPGDTDKERDIYIIDMGVQNEAGRAPGAVASARRKPRKRHRRRLRLVTAESIAPRMGVARLGRIVGTDARLRLRCPKVERSGPCHGRVKLLARRSHRVLAAGRFRIASGRTNAIKLRGRRLLRPRQRLLARVRGADLLGNRRLVSATVRLRRAR